MPFNAEDFKNSMASVQQYSAGCNLFWINWYYAACPGIPVSTEAVKRYAATQLKNPTRDLKPIVIALDESVALHFGNLKVVSPEEAHHALAFRICQAVADGDEQELREWRACVLSMKFEFKLLPSTRERFLYNVNHRLALADDYDSLGRTPSQRIFKLVQFRSAEEKRTGTKLNAEELFNAWTRMVKSPESKLVEKVSATFVEYALLVHERLLSDSDLRAIVRDIDGRYAQATPLTVQSLREIVRVGKTKKYISWGMCTLRDLLDAAVYSWRDLGSRSLVPRPFKWS